MTEILHATISTSWDLLGLVDWVQVTPLTWQEPKLVPDTAVTFPLFSALYKSVWPWLATALASVKATVLYTLTEPTTTLVTVQLTSACRFVKMLASTVLMNYKTQHVICKVVSVPVASCQSSIVSTVNHVMTTM